MLRKLRLEDCESQDSLGLQSEVLKRKGWKEGLRGKERDRRWEKERKAEEGLSRSLCVLGKCFTSEISPK